MPRKLFFYSGHGHSRRDKGYIVPINAPNPYSDDKGFVRKAVAMNQVLTWAQNIESKHAIRRYTLPTNWRRQAYLIDALFTFNSSDSF